MQALAHQCLSWEEPHDHVLYSFLGYQPSSQRFPCVCFIWGGGRPHPEVLSPGYSLRNPVTFLESSENQKDARVEARLTACKTKMVYPLYYLSGPTFVGFWGTPGGVKTLFWIFTQGSLLKSSWYHGGSRDHTRISHI